MVNVDAPADKRSVGDELGDELGDKLGDELSMELPISISLLIVVFMTVGVPVGPLVGDVVGMLKDEGLFVGVSVGLVVRGNWTTDAAVGALVSSAVGDWFCKFVGRRAGDFEGGSVGEVVAS